jgi:hypothetical protein
LAVPVMKTRFYDREAFRAMFSYGGTIAGLSNKSVSNLPTARARARPRTTKLYDRTKERLARTHFWTRWSICIQTVDSPNGRAFSNTRLGVS